MDVHAVYDFFLRPFRRRRMLAFARTFRLDRGTTVLDVGGTRYNWALLDSAPRVTLLNLESPHAGTGLPGNVAAVVGTGTQLAFADAAFDVAFSNSVIEHVGGPEAREAFARELRRVGRGVWVQTPARSFFVEPHLLAPFLHWLPVGWQRRLIRWVSLWGWISRPTPERVERFLAQTHLLDAAELRALFPDCELRRERFLGLTKSYVAVRLPVALR
ncbi:MAG: methyltransferase domain-containing protein [Myxococcota bacterium]|jgi:hypothetical protein|nr:hypothetical protein [Deltaproteobacteria bacterium]MCP4240421.1 methyltransferase domain-containing protein [bacterium]MDP6074784.1 methyltransferase domain-containing protein [Myxococcota bacterium]MDP6243925.1 methyltransferase domain-containing protein [Myxococcota bacterium]MDP7076305.1 methyltransferase domain-containing protein [Myxococcota bacterium]